MNRYLAALAAATLMVAMGFATASAGVVITETETVVSGQPAGQTPQPKTRTMMIEGNKQKTIMDGGREVITDLDKGVTIVIDPSKKRYFERPFPPPNMMGHAPGAPNPSQFTKTGKSRTVAGYPCDDYDGKGKFPMGDFTVISCVSTKAPGAAEFTKFQKTMMAKLKDTQLAMPVNPPDGIPMVQDTTTKVNITSMPNLPPETVEKLKKQFADRPPIVTKVELTKLEEKKLPASEFAIPAGYTKREPMMGMPGMGGHPMSSAGGSSSMAGGSSSAGGSSKGAGAASGNAPLTVAPPANP
jgi:hypothetical protein